MQTTLLGKTVSFEEPHPGRGRMTGTVVGASFHGMKDRYSGTFFLLIQDERGKLHSKSAVDCIIVADED